MLTGKQRYETEQRTLHDAELIKRGARLNELGRLVLTDGQVKRLRLMGDMALLAASTMAEGQWESPLLDMDVATLWGAFYVGSGHRTTNALWRANLNTLRKVLAAGSDRVGGIRTLGGKSVNEITRLMAAYLPSVEWKAAPTVADVATYCQDLDQVPVAVLGVSAGQDLSVHGLLQLTAFERAQSFWHDWYDGNKRIQGDVAYVAAQNYAEDFATAKFEISQAAGNA